MTVKFRQSDESYAEAATAQIDHLRQAADLIEAGSLEGVDRHWIAAVLRHAADGIKTEQPRGRGAKPKFDPGGAALLFAKMTHVDGMSANAAYETLAAEAEVSVEAMKKALAKQGDDFTRLLSSGVKVFKSKT